MQLRDDMMLDQTQIAATDPVPFATPSQVALVAGTTILTLAGEIRAEDLMPGDRIITRDCGTAILADVSHAWVDAATVRLKAGAMGRAQPARDMALPAGSVLHMRDGRACTAVRACDLVGSAGASLAERGLATIVSLIFQRPHVIYADGIEMWAAPA